MVRLPLQRWLVIVMLCGWYRIVRMFVGRASIQHHEEVVGQFASMGIMSGIQGL